MHLRVSILVALIAIGCGGPTPEGLDAGTIDARAVDAAMTIDAGSSVDGAAPTDAGAASIVVDAGADVTIALPTRSVTLHGTATGTPTTAWTQVDGTDATITGADTSTLVVSGLVPGAYTFRLTATDAGRTASDDVVVTLTSSGTTHYVAPTGSDTSDGTRAHPWATLGHACGAVSGAGDLIHVDAGAYVETAQCVLAPQVSLEGEGDGTHVVLFNPVDNAYGGGVQLASTLGGTDGSQSITSLLLDGADTAYRAIVVRGRGNVLVRHVRFTDFLASALVLLPVGHWGEAPAVYEHGNEISSSITTDCSDRGSSGGGVIILGGQEETVMRDNTFNQFGRTQGRNGDVVGGVFGHNRGWSYYRNVSTKPDYDGPQMGGGGRGWNFVLEIWNNEGGTEIWGNTFHGGGDAIDIGGSTDAKGAYAYSWYVHDNAFDLAAQVAAPVGALVPMGVQFEVSTVDAVVSHNHFVRLGHGVQIILTHSTDIATQRISIHDNYFEDMGLSDDSIGGSMVNILLGTGMLIGDIHIDNNTMLSGTSGQARAALLLTNTNAMGTLGPIDFRNNIVEHVGTWGYITFNGSGPITGVTSSHNILWDNASANATFTHDTTSLTPPHPTVSWAATADDLIVDPMLGADGHPMSGSPAFGAGTDVGHGTTIGAFPE